MDVADILQLRPMRGGAVGGGGGQDGGVLGAAERQELPALVARDVAQDPAVALAVEEPVGPGRLAQPVGTEAVVLTTRPMAPARTSSSAWTVASLSWCSE